MAVGWMGGLERSVDCLFMFVMYVGLVMSHIV